MRRIELSRRASQRIAAGHPWVYRNECEASLSPDSVEAVLLSDERGRPLGSALLDGAAPVPIKAYSHREEPFDAALLRRRIAAALDWRRKIVSSEHTGYRLVFSESDALPGLIADRFGSALSIQLGMRNYQPFLPELAAELAAALPAGQSPDAVVVEQSGLRSLFLGDASKTKSIYRLNSLDFEADLLQGPKTGAFLDQRENYLAVRNWVNQLQLDGRALDLFSSTGGFALHLAGRFRQVDAVDSSPIAVSLIEANAARNQIGNIRAIQSDVKQFLKGLGQARRRYECVVVDPPAFAKQARQKQEATRAYFDLNLRALGAVASDGLLVSCSCSHAIGEADWITVLREVAQQSRRNLTLLESRTQAIDHRVTLQIPESSYLKCLIFSVSGSM